MKHRILTALACGTLLASAAVATPASAHGGDWDPGPPTAGKVDRIAGGLSGPLSLEVDRYGLRYVSENFGGELSRIDRDGTVTTVVTGPEGSEIAAVSSRQGVVYYAQNVGGPEGVTSAALMAYGWDRTPRQLADLLAHERAENPDQGNTYGFDGLSPECRAEVAEARPEFAGALEPYTGGIDSHPFATLPARAAIYVADAGANAILRVGYDGTVSTVATMPALAPITITTDMATAANVPTCVAGSTFVAEPVPTDVEWGPDGWLYVTLLPGGPEDASLGARGAVVKVNPRTAEVDTVATGFVGATNLAVSKRTGNIYVAELFGGADAVGQVSVLTRGSDTPEVLVALPSPAALELRKGKLYVTTSVFAPDAGELTVVQLREKHHGGYHKNAVTEDGISSGD